MASYTWEYFALDAFGRKVGTAAVVATADAGAPQVMYDANGQPVVPGAGADKDPEIGAGGLVAAEGFAGEVTPFDGEGGSHEAPHNDDHHHKHHDDDDHHQGHHEHHDHHRQHGEGNATVSHAPSHPQPSAPAAPVTHHNEGDLELTSPVGSDRIVGDP
jgi:hypothetical protein